MEDTNRWAAGGKNVRIHAEALTILQSQENFRKARRERRFRMFYSSKNMTDFSF
jgi:hypothetical protein